MRIAAAKTDAGVREVDLTPALQALLAEYRSRSPYAKPGDLVFPTNEGKWDNPSNVRNRFLDSAARVANTDLRAAGREPMPDLMPHSLRRPSFPFCSPQGPMCRMSWRGQGIPT